ncbi:hypothetical protein RND71_036766 [Anisodus tanguticus]|uniref:Uncharacterized protein n=1 Tax=Anisodus tanguticus TaxID=243964 RepID=A0AAE1UUG5_9SOLA|nr:hypothetical protein RND71_036766 [Anisodus tanguticus]
MFHGPGPKACKGFPGSDIHMFEVTGVEDSSSPSIFRPPPHKFINVILFIIKIEIMFS